MHRSGKLRSSIRGLVLGSLGLVCALSANVALAQPIDTEAVFGQAVHQYFAGDYQAVVEDMTQTIESGVQDPRMYYYRGLAKLQMGDQEAANADFQTGARWEEYYRGRRHYNMGRALMRVQGATRMMIEEARMAARHQAEAKVLEGAPVNRRAALAALPQSSSGGVAAQENASLALPRPNLPDLSDVNDPTAPFSNEPQVDIPAIDPNMEEPMVEPPATDNPFGEPEAPAADDPFGEPEQPAADPFAEPEGSEPEGADPFAEPTNDGRGATPAADPFSEPAAGNNAPAKAATGNVRGRKVLSGLFKALSAPVRQAAQAGAEAMQNLGPGMGPGAGPGGPGLPPGEDPFGGDDPFGEAPQAGGQDPFGGN